MTPLTTVDPPETFPAMPYLAAPDDPLLAPPGTRLMSRPIDEWRELHLAPVATITPIRDTMELEAA